MKTDVKAILKKKGKIDIYTDQRFDQVKDVMKFGMKQDAALNNYLSLDPLNKSQWVADHMVILADLGKI